METLDTAGGCIAGAALATTRLRRALAGEARRGGQEERDEEGTAAAEAGAARGRRGEIAAREVETEAAARMEEAVAAMGWSGRETGTGTATAAVVVPDNSGGEGI